MIDHRKIIESGPFTIIKWKNTAGWPIEYASDNIQVLTGFPAAEFTAESISFFDLLAEETLTQIDHKIKRAREHVLESIQLDVFPLRHRDSRIIWVDAYVSILRNALGNVIGYTGYLLDVSNRVETEHNLENSREETRAIINALPDTILQISRNGELKKFLTHNGAQTDDHKATVYLSDFFPADFAALVPEYLADTIQTGRVYIYEYENHSFDNKTLYYEARFSKKSENDALIIIREITSRKENERLLQQAMEDVAAANIEKNKFLSNMSHELRTPLNAIMGFSQLLIADDQSDSTLAQEILSAGDHLLSLINDILDISRIEAGKIDLLLEPVQLSSIASDCQTLLTPMMQAQNIKFSLSIPDENILVQTDKTRLTQVLLNLLSNAVKYNRPDGKVALTAFILNEQNLRIEIADTGNGLDQTQVNNLFTPFERVGAERTDVEGTGLGLALSKQLVELMQGNIGVLSIPGIGSTFWITIPLAGNVSSLLAADVSLQSGSTIPGQSLSGKSLSIVYIEDNKQNQKLIQSIISGRTRHSLQIAGNGMDGLALINRTLPDLVLLDITLPDMSGYEVLSELKSSPTTRHIPVLAISANATEEDLKTARKVDFYDYLTKPINLSRLLVTLRRIEQDIFPQHVSQG
ncbi:MAG: ATP-binding protein [Gammaproteobacteria bacterium]|nr:ATP-binding protein [Gammaproteobacteria bacterium]MDH5653146.1 ATP-binding protein [Gammaproteobacteria bacterium]